MSEDGFGEWCEHCHDYALFCRATCPTKMPPAVVAAPKPRMTMGPIPGRDVAWDELMAAAAVRPSNFWDELDAQERETSRPGYSPGEEALWKLFCSRPSDWWPHLTGLTRQVPVCGFFIDFGIPKTKRGLEIDGLRFHGGQREWQRDHQRQRRLEAAGWHLTRFTANEAQHAPLEVLNELEALWRKPRPD